MHGNEKILIIPKLFKINVQKIEVNEVSQQSLGEVFLDRKPQRQMKCAITRNNLVIVQNHFFYSSAPNVVFSLKKGARLRNIATIS